MRRSFTHKGITARSWAKPVALEKREGAAEGLKPRRQGKNGSRRIENKRGESKCTLLLRRTSKNVEEKEVPRTE